MGTETIKHGRGCEGARRSVSPTDANGLKWCAFVFSLNLRGRSVEFAAPATSSVGGG